MRDYEFEQRYFVGVGMGMQVTLEPKWFNSDWQWYIGVNKGELSEQECRELLSPGQLDWKFGSSRQVEILFKHRAEGLRLNPGRSDDPRAAVARRMDLLRSRPQGCPGLARRARDADSGDAVERLLDRQRRPIARRAATGRVAPRQACDVAIRIVRGADEIATEVRSGGDDRLSRHKPQGRPTNIFSIANRCGLP